jgi:hypothetical protein
MADERYESSMRQAEQSAAAEMRRINREMAEEFEELLKQKKKLVLGQPSGPPEPEGQFARKLSERLRLRMMAQSDKEGR